METPARLRCASPVRSAVFGDLSAAGWQRCADLGRELEEVGVAGQVRQALTQRAVCGVEIAAPVCQLCLKKSQVGRGGASVVGHSE